MEANKFRRQLRLMWAVMMFQYKTGKPKWYNIPFPRNSPDDDREEAKARREADLQ